MCLTWLGAPLHPNRASVARRQRQEWGAIQGKGAGWRRRTRRASSNEKGPEEPEEPERVSESSTARPKDGRLLPPFSPARLLVSQNPPDERLPRTFARSSSCFEASKRGALRCRFSGILGPVRESVARPEPEGTTVGRVVQLRLRCGHSAVPGGRTSRFHFSVSWFFRRRGRVEAENKPDPSSNFPTWRRR
ncbi:hypothetical protein CIRG_08039 [Coccidioides immitis RMSCC 2394]|uniref:Uncharacterized protein n=1 Tax=Coccidioides immitis RMSCC 2394 TaxID=404692 RepID=A0A0J6YMI0_COCIT|nr:hypothetical protein CIRG_08039 [Coccidioides immitis RMSCC 2394]